MGDDLISKVEKDAYEDDQRHVVVIGINVGVHFGDISGKSSDLFSSYIVIISSWYLC